MSLPDANPNLEEEAARLARCFDGAAPWLAGALGLPWDELLAADEQAGQGTAAGAVSITWHSSHSLSPGGTIGVESCAFDGVARVIVRPVGAADSISHRLAVVVLKLKELRVRGGGAMWEDGAAVLIGPRSAGLNDPGIADWTMTYPLEEDGRAIALFDIPISLRIDLQIMADPRG